MSEKNITPTDGAESTFNADSNTNAVLVQDRIKMAANFLIKIGAFLPINKKFYTYIWCQSGKKNKTIAFDVKKEEFKIARKAIELNDEGYNIYFGVHLTDRPFGEHERPKKEDITAQVAIIADLDCKSIWHVDTDKKKYPTVEQAKKFLPFEPSLLIDSGGGLHSYVLLSKPIHFTNDDERKQAVSRNIDYIEMIRRNAGEFSKAIDGVHDLPRILRLPGTYNLKHGKENAPLCKIIEDTQSYYPLKSLDILIKPRPITPAKNPSYNTGSTNQKNLTQEKFDSDKLKNNYPAVGDKPSEQERALAMLKTFSPSSLTYDEWLHIGMALKNNGNTCADWSDWSSQDDRFKIGECESKWSGFNRTDLTIATIHDMAKKYGNYSEKDFLRDWYLDNKIARELEFSRKSKTKTESRDKSILSVPNDSVKERTDISMSTDTTVTKATKMDLFTLKEAANYVGVNEKTLRRWNKQKIFEPYLIDHHGDFFYTREELEQLKSVYTKSRNKTYSNVRTMSAGQNVKDSLEFELQEINKKLAAFEQEKSAAIEKLQAQISFDKDSVFADEILNAAAFCKLYDKKTFSDFKAAIQNQIKSQGTEKFITEWSGEIRDRLDDIKSRRADLLAQKKIINAKIISLNFVANHDELKGFVIPEGYEISNAGIEKIVGDKSLTVSRVPAVIKSKSKNVEDKTFKLILAYLAENGTWQSVPATGEEIIFNARKLIDLRAYGLPVTSTNANLFVDYLDAFKAANEKILPMSLTVSRCGWQNLYGKDYFVEPRRKNFISDDTHNNRNIEVVVDDSSTFAKSLKTVGSLDQWRKAYDIAKKSPIARLIIAASVAAPFLKIFDGERNFVLYIYGTTRGGKSTCLLCGASAVGNTDMVISFDGTNNGLLGRAAETTDYAFFVDEKQSADARLKDQFQRFVYSVANGKERQRANKDGSFKSVREWQNITICNGETELLDDNATEGAFTRLLQIHAPKTILAADDCKEIRRIIRHNYGHALPLVIDKIFDYGFDNLRENFNDACEVFAENFPNLLDDYRRYVAIMTLADAVLNMCLGVDEDAAFADAVDNAKIIFEFVPTIADISDFEREKNFILGFIAAKSTQFEGTPDFLKGGGREILGKFDDDFVYITARALKQACDESHFDYKKIITDSIENGFFIADEKIRKGRKTPYPFVVKKINGVSANCYRIQKIFINSEDF